MTTKSQTKEKDPTDIKFQSLAKHYTHNLKNYEVAKQYPSFEPLDKFTEQDVIRIVDDALRRDFKVFDRLAEI